MLKTKYIICPECKGSGKIDVSHFMPKESYAECSTCMGEGKLYVYSEEEKPKKVKVVLQKEYGKGQFTLGDQGVGMSLAIADKKLKEEEYKSKH